MSLFSRCRLLSRAFCNAGTIQNQLVRGLTSTHKNITSHEDYHIYRFISKGFDRAIPIQRTVDQAKIRDMNEQELAKLLAIYKRSNWKDFDAVKYSIDSRLKSLLEFNNVLEATDLDLWFYISGLFFEYQMKPRFLSLLIQQISMLEKDILSNDQLLNMLFLLILNREQSGLLSRHENRINQILSEASFEEVTLISTAYFKTKTPVTNREMLKKIISITTRSLNSINFEESGYCSVVKCIRYSKIYDCREQVLNLISELIAISKCKTIFVSAFNATQTIKMMESYRIFDHNLLDDIVKSMFENLDDFRIKDIQYALTSLSNFAYQDCRLSGEMKKNLDLLCDKIISETRVDTHMQSYHIMPMLRAMAILGYYNDKLIDYANRLFEDESKLEKAKKVLEFDRSALLLYVATRLEGNQVKFLQDGGQHIKEISAGIDRVTGNIGSVRQDTSIKYLSFLLQTKQDWLVINNAFRRIATSLIDTVELRDHIFKFNFQYTLPHQNFADLIVTKGCDEPGQFDAGSLMPKQVPIGQCHCLILALRNFDYLDGNERLCGYKQLTSRLLTKLGYTVFNVDIDKPDIASLAESIRLTLDKSNLVAV